MALFILSRAKVIICEGQLYVDYLRKELGVESHYFPNFVLECEVPGDVKDKLRGDKLRVLFVGYCFEGKGVFELVEGCQLALKKGVPIELTLVGHEHDDFTRFLDSKSADNLSYTINRIGIVEHGEVLAHYESHDVFCMPSRHRGEGHTNTVNEAMMMGMVIVSTRHGFLESVLADNSSFFLDELTPLDIANTLKMIHDDQDEARRRAANARTRLMSFFTSNAAFANLSAHYETLTQQGKSQK
jgi:glycosyltransferase involved in cell wall biosynthesis